jgi:nucleotide-binding universal stress UspA family protein
MFQTILVPVNDDDMSERAVTVAAALASKFKGELALLHISEPLPTYSVQVASYLPEGELERAAIEHGKILLERFANLLDDSLQVQLLRRTVHEGVWRDILTIGKELNADTIVMGTHGRTGLARAVVGSVAEQVARHAAIPVVLVR